MTGPGVVAFEQAVKLFAQGRYAAARRLLRGIAGGRPELSTVYLFVARALQHSVASDKAVQEAHQIAIRLDPKSEVASLSLFNCLWEQALFDDAIDEVYRFSRRSDSKRYEEISTEIAEHFRLPVGEIEKVSRGSYASTSPTARGLKRRWNSQKNPLDQLHGIKRKQNAIRKRKSKGIIDSIEKSKQAVDNELRRIRTSGDLADSPITKTKLQRLTKRPRN